MRISDKAEVLVKRKYKELARGGTTSLREALDVLLGVSDEG